MIFLCRLKLIHFKIPITHHQSTLTTTLILHANIKRFYLDTSNHIKNPKYISFFRTNLKVKKSCICSLDLNKNQDF